MVAATNNTLRGARQFIALLLFPALLTACGADRENAAAPTLPRAVKTVVAGLSGSATERVLSGYLQPHRVTDLSFQVEGHVLEVLAAPGDRVEAGARLAQIDPQPFELRVKSAEAELKRARADLRESRENYDSQKRVYDQDYISKTTFEKVAAALSRAESGVSAAESSLALARRDLENTYLLAPFDGIITRRELEPFQTIAAYKAVFQIQGENDLEVRFLVPSALAEKIAIGDQVAIALPAAGLRDIPATITERSIEADTKGSFPVVATLQQRVPGLLAGVAVEVHVRGGSGPDNLVLPQSAAAIDETGQHYVFIYRRESSTVNKRAVQRSLLSADTISITRGIEAGEIVVVAGVEFLRDGQEVSLYRAPGIAAIPAANDNP